MCSFLLGVFVGVISVLYSVSVLKHSKNRWIVLQSGRNISHSYQEMLQSLFPPHVQLKLIAVLVFVAILGSMK